MKSHKSFPNEELYSLTNQMGRAAISIPANIAEGAARNSRREFSQFLYVALGSLAELETQIIISQRLGYIKDNELMEPIEKLRRKLLNFIEHIIKHIKNAKK